MTSHDPHNNPVWSSGQEQLFHSAGEGRDCQKNSGHTACGWQSKESMPPPTLSLVPSSVFSKESKTVESCSTFHVSVLLRMATPKGMCQSLTCCHSDVAICTVLMGKCIQGKMRGELPAVRIKAPNIPDPASILSPVLKILRSSWPL